MSNTAAATPVNTLVAPLCASTDQPHFLRATPAVVVYRKVCRPLRELRLELRHFGYTQQGGFLYCHPERRQGHCVTMKFVELAPVPSGVVMAIGPVVAPFGTYATTWVSVSTVNFADTPLKVTLVAP